MNWNAIRTWKLLTTSSYDARLGSKPLLIGIKLVACDAQEFSSDLPDPNY